MSIQKLRKMTSMPMGMCAQAWKDSSQDLDKAIELLLTKGAGKVRKLQDREVKAGHTYVYCHHDGATVGVVSLLCETDFVARSIEFVGLARELAMQAATEESTPDIASFLASEQLQNSSQTIAERVDQLSVATGEKIVIGSIAVHRIFG